MKKVVLFLTRMVSTSSTRNLGQSLMPSQQVLVLIAEIVHGRPVLDVYLEPLPITIHSYNARHGRMNFICLYWTVFLGLK